MGLFRIFGAQKVDANPKIYGRHLESETDKRMEKAVDNSGFFGAQKAENRSSPALNPPQSNEGFFGYFQDDDRNLKRREASIQVAEDNKKLFLNKASPRVDANPEVYGRYLESETSRRMEKEGDNSGFFGAQNPGLEYPRQRGNDIWDNEAREAERVRLKAEKERENKKVLKAKIEENNKTVKA